jgi:Ca2+:H+ antiporter
VLLLVVFLASIPFSLRGTAAQEPAEVGEAPGWPLGLALGVLGVSSVAAAFVSDWFADYAVSVILNSPLQIALGLTPLLVLLSFLLGTAHLILVLPPLLVAALALATVLPALIVFDGESIWLEGVALIGLYGIIAAAFWWG